VESGRRNGDQSDKDGQKEIENVTVVLDRVAGQLSADIFGLQSGR
jgi:hypothetical protein